MAKALFFSLPLDGHVNPSLPVVRELTHRGDDVAYYATDRFAGGVIQSGARYVAYQPDSLDRMRQLPDRTDEVSWRLMRATADVLETGLEDFRAERPDYIITDSVAPWGQWVGAILGVPVVTSISTFAFNRQVMTLGFTRGVRPTSVRRMFAKLRHVSRAQWLRRRLRRRYRVDGPGVLGSVMGSSRLNVVYTSRYFQPCADSFDDSFHFVGPSIADRDGSRVSWAWDDRQVVYVSLGTLFNADLAFYQRCFAAFAGEPYQVIMSVGSSLTRDRLSGGPGNVIVEAHVPQLDVLQHAAGFVSHGGMNSVNESLYFGLPLLVVPQMGEQAMVGRQVEALGAGLYLEKEDATPDALRDAVRRLLTQRSFRDAAAVVRRSLREAGGPARAADAIVAFTR